MTFGRPVACLASFTAASVASAPELAKKNVSMPAGVIVGQTLGQRLEQVVAVTLTCAWMNRAACSWIAATTCGMAVAGARDRDAAREVEVLGAVGRGHPRAATGDHLEVGDLEPHIGEMPSCHATLSTEIRHIAWATVGP